MWLFSVTSRTNTRVRVTGKYTKCRVHDQVYNGAKLTQQTLQNNSTFS